MLQMNSLFQFMFMMLLFFALYFVVLVNDLHIIADKKCQSLE